MSPVREEKKKQTRQRLMEAAWQLVTRQGLEKTTVQQIAALANAGTGTFYNYFPSKEMALAVYLDEATGRVLDGIVLSELPDSPEEAVSLMFNVIFKAADVPLDRALLRDLMAASFKAGSVNAGEDQSATAKLVQADERIITMVSLILQRKESQVYLKPGRDPFLAAMAIYSHFTMGWMGYLVEYLPTLDAVLNMVREMNHLIFSGLLQEKHHE